MHSTLAVFLLALAALAAFAPTAARANDCWLRCEGTAECQVEVSNASPIKVNGRFEVPPSPCSKLGMLMSGTRVEGMARTKNGEVMPFAAVGEQKVSVAFGKLGLVDCAYSDKGCREQRDKAMIAGRAGKAFDGPAGHKPSGTPCAIGLPCGVVLAPPQAWSLRIEDPRAAEATLQITALRNATGSVDVAVRDGGVQVPAGFVRAGASYSYALSSRGGEVIAAGQFSAAAPAIEADLRAEESKALAAGLSPLAARLKALLVNELDWDAMQFAQR